MLAKINLLALLVGFLQVHLSHTFPVEGPVEARTTFRTCAVFVQRWYDNSFDLAAYAYNFTYDGPFQGLAKTYQSTTPWGVGGEPFPTVGNIGSHPILTTNVANPAVVNGQVNWDDPGKLSFTWGTTAWDTYSPGNPCTTHASSSVRSNNTPTNYTCPFQCDSAP